MFNLKLAAGGLKGYLPFLASYRGTGGTISSRYCYSVWLRHFTLIRDAGYAGSMDAIVELGPGDSIGVGIASLLTGARRYLALDVVQHADARTNLAVLDDLLEFFRRQEPIPGDDEFPNVSPRLADYGFPARHISREQLAAALAPDRIAHMRACLESPGAVSPAGMIRYVCPWYDDSLAEAESVDVILSQGALQDIEALDTAYRIMTKWLKPGGVMSHQIDFGFPGTGKYWNEHWGYSDVFWRIARGNRPYYFNREPYSRYLQLSERQGHRILQTQMVEGRSSLPRRKANKRFRNLADQDFATRSGYIVTTKNGDQSIPEAR
jgi:hypothetical protein